MHHLSIFSRMYNHDEQGVLPPLERKSGDDASDLHPLVHYLYKLILELYCLFRTTTELEHSCDNDKASFWYSCTLPR